MVTHRDKWSKKRKTDLNQANNNITFIHNKYTKKLAIIQQYFTTF